ncbi:MAG: efflux RND transporter permease subunit [Planctomycetes bacterium]|nr:efflux RND transporter permease subunit [Planctomycetota bacterium]
MTPDEPARPSLTARVVEAFLRGKLSALLVIVSLVLGAVALLVTPREEDPQIVVPLADVFVSAPGCSAEEIERQVAGRLEKLLHELSGVEHVYSMSQRDRAVVTVRFRVGEDREDSLLKVHDKLAMNADRVPPQVAAWVVKPVEIDDVPILVVTLHADDEDDHRLRRVAEEVEGKLKEVPGTGRTSVVGGRPRRLNVRLDPHAASARGVGLEQVARALAAADVRLPAGALEAAGVRYGVDAGALLRDPDEARDLVVGVSGGAPVYLGEVAEVTLGPAEPTGYVRLGFGPAAGAAAGEPDRAAVSVAVAKRRGENAVWIADALLARMADLEREVLPDGVRWEVTRNYGATADAKVDELVEALAVALVIVAVLLALSLGRREALIVATAVPITFGLTLFVNWLAGYTINRVTLFALILALGLVVDDPIIDVENIHRHLRRRVKDPLRAVLDAVNEIRPPIILATLAVIVSFLPLAFITGMMGPYMRPMALNVPLAMLMSLVVAFTVTPWMSYHLLKGAAHHDDAAPDDAPSALHRAYGAVLGPFLRGRGARWALLGVTMLLFGLSCGLAVDRKVPLKMLPFDDKDELQVVLDLPEGTPLERTEAVAAELAAYLRRVPEVTSVVSYAGVPSPMDFNGLVRHYFLREGDHLADLRVNLVHKRRRVHQSHEVALRVRRDLEALAAPHGAALKLVELPPGPPVLSTVTAEVVGRPYTPHERLVEAAAAVEARLRREPGVVDVDTTAKAPGLRLSFVPDRERLRLSGLSEGQVARAVRAAVAGEAVAVLHDPHDVVPTPVELRLPRAARGSLEDLDAVALVGERGNVVRLSELGRWERGREDRTIHRKDMRQVVYVTAELAGRPPAEVVLDVQADQGAPASAAPRPLEARSHLRPGGGDPWSVPPDVEVVWSGEGEWDITLDVFRDMGLAFLAACLGIYVLLVHETRSYLLPLILMISIPLTVIGILPGFWLLGLGAAPIDGWANPTSFTATAMIGMIALAGLAVRNAILLIEFVQVGLAEGRPLEEALVHAGAVRLRPILLTAGTAMLAAWPITLDPIFSGLAWALIFGLVVSTAFTLVIVPVVYYMAIAGSSSTPTSSPASIPSRRSVR